MKILYATTLSSNCLKKEGNGISWLTPLIKKQYPEIDIFTVCEDLEPPHDFRVFNQLFSVLDSLPNKHTIYKWTLNTGLQVKGSGTHERLKHICMGRNLIQLHAIDNGYDYIVFVDSDAKPVDNFWEKLISHNYPLVGGILSEYFWVIKNNNTPQKSIPNHEYYERFELYKKHKELIPVTFNTAGFNVVHRDIFSRVQWRYDIDHGMTDDPCYGFDAANLGYPWLVDSTILAHHPAVFADKS